MKKISLLLFALVTLLLVGCSTKPTYYSKDYVMQYVRNMYGKDCDYTDLFTEADEEGNPIYVYQFQDKNDIPFTVTTYTRHISIDASTSIFYEKAITDDYLQNVYNAHLTNLSKLLGNYTFDAECKEYKNISVWLDSYTQLADVADFAEKADALLSLEYNAKGYDHHKTSGISISVYLKPDAAASGTQWRETYGNNIGGVTMSSSKTERLTAADAFTTMERALVNGIKTGRFDQYRLPDDILYKYPAPWIKLTSVNGTENLEFSYTFQYDTENDCYWISDLDPCQDFAEFPYNYSDKGTFAKLVELLGGTYHCDNWTATWEIGDNKWTAKLETAKEGNSEYRYNKLILKQNGKKITLSDPDGRSNGTVSGRAFTVEDLEMMLGVTIEIDQADMTATMIPR